MNPGRVQRFFLYLSSSDLDLLRDGSAVEIHHQATIGVSIFLSSSFAFAACSYAVFVVTQHAALAIAVGLLWGSTIMNLDRLLVSSSSVGASSSLEADILRRYI